MTMSFDNSFIDREVNPWNMRISAFFAHKLTGKNNFSLFSYISQAYYKVCRKSIFNSLRSVSIRLTGIKEKIAEIPDKDVDSFVKAFTFVTDQFVSVSEYLQETEGDNHELTVLCNEVLQTLSEINSDLHVRKNSFSSVIENHDLRDAILSKRDFSILGH